MPDEGGGQNFAEPLAVSDELRDESGRFEARQFAGQRVGHADEVDLQVVPGLAEPERLGRGCERTSADGSSALKSSQSRPFRNFLFYLHRFRRASFVALGAGAASDAKPPKPSEIDMAGRIRRRLPDDAGDGRLELVDHQATRTARYAAKTFHLAAGRSSEV